MPDLSDRLLYLNRLEASSRVLQGLLASQTIADQQPGYELLARTAVEQADALLVELDKATGLFCVDCLGNVSSAALYEALSGRCLHCSTTSAQIISDLLAYVSGAIPSNDPVVIAAQDLIRKHPKE